MVEVAPNALNWSYFEEADVCVCVCVWLMFLPGSLMPKRVSVLRPFWEPHHHCIRGRNAGPGNFLMTKTKVLWPFLRTTPLYWEDINVGPGFASWLNLQQGVPSFFWQRPSLTPISQEKKNYRHCFLQVLKMSTVENLAEIRFETRGCHCKIFFSKAALCISGNSLWKS